MLRTNNCGQLSAKDIKKKVTLCGWTSTNRDHGGLIFIDLRDRYGITQIVFDPKNKEIFKQAELLRREDVIQIAGEVRPRPKNMENPKLKTGKIEVLVKELKTLNKSSTPPIEIEDRIVANEDLRLEYRYLDLRRPIMQNYLLIRHKTAQAAREFLNKKDFLEIETPLLVRATPEGARDYLVPSRVNPGKFYALPQSPQLYKQLLMISGCDRYYQIARCLRDEDLRADRQPEHTQIDLEMSFVEEEDIYEVIEGLMKHIFKKVLKINIKTPFQKMPYDEAIDKYGSDKPDLRFGLELINITEIAKISNFEVFRKAELIKAINPEKDFSRKEIESLTDFASSVGAKGLAWMKYNNNKLESSIQKFFPENLQKELIRKIKPKKNSTIFFIADTKKQTNDILANIRNKLGKDLNLIEKNDFKFCWIINFPLFEWNEDEQRWEPAHHMFTSPRPEHIKYLEKNPEKVYGILYDLILNGLELLSGSIRINQPELQEKVMKVIGLDKKQAEKKFGFLLKAFKYGAPPHGGVGLGFDRLVALMCGINDIREVIAFPKNKAAQCPMDSSPSEVSPEQLKELNIKLDIIKKE